MSIVLTVTNGNDSGVGSLRDNVAIANSNPAVVEINFNPSVTTVTLTGSGMQITRSYTITGAGVFPVISGYNDNIFNSTTAGITVNLDNMTLTGAIASAISMSNSSNLNLTNVTITENFNTFSGGGISLDNITCVMNNCVISNNSIDTLSAGDAGGIYVTNSVLTVNNTQITGNTATESGGGIFALESTVNIDLSNIRLNTATKIGGGGAVFSKSIVTINRTTFDSNTARSGLGGGIFIDALSFPGQIFSQFNITNSTLSNNVISNSSGFAFGGGLGISGDTLLNSTITNVTISGNTITSGYGGGVYMIPTNILISNSTISNNSILTGVNSAGGGIVTNDGAPTIINNTIIAGNTGSAFPDVSGDLTGSGYNLIGDGTGSNGITNGVNGNQVGSTGSEILPMLNSLGNYGGPTETMSLQLGSPAIDAGSVLLVPIGTVYDQRGTPYLRVSGPNVDIGAFELQQEPVCYRGDSIVLSFNNINKKISNVKARNIHPDIHKVFDTESKTFVNVLSNVVTGKVSEFYLLKKNCLGKNEPSADFYVTGGHKIDINGIKIKARNIPQAVKIFLPLQQVYTICTEFQCPILINNLKVLTWNQNEFLQYCKKRTIDYQLVE